MINEPRKADICEGVSVYENCVPLHLLEYVLEKVKGSKSFEFFECISYGDKYEKHGYTADDVAGDYGFSTGFYSAEGSITTPEFQALLLIPPFVEVFNPITRCKGNLTLPTLQRPSSPIFHVDRQNPTKAMVVYLNDVDGATVVRSRDGEIFKIAPKVGRVVVMDGDIYHGAEKPTIGPRFILNYTFN